MRYQSSLVALLAALLLAGAQIARAEQRQFGAYEVHYSVFAADFLQPAVASALGIVRAPDRAVLNLAIRARASGSASDSAVRASVRGTRGDLIHKTELEFRLVEEQDAAYYLAQFPFRNGETLYFELEMQPAGEQRPLQLRFEKTLYVD
jgi:hypothetical protein